MLVVRPKNRIGYADVADLKADPVVAFQHKYYPYIALFMGFIFPTLVAGYGWGDFRVSLKCRYLVETKVNFSRLFLGWLFLRWCTPSCLCTSRHFLCQQFSPLLG